MSFLRANRNEIGLALATVLAVVIAGALDSNHTYFDSPGPSLTNILRQTATLGIFALGSTVVIIAGGIDLSCGAVIAFSGTIFCGILLALNPLGVQGVGDAHIAAGEYAVAVAGTLVTGVLIGSLHTWLITVVGLPPFVATLATLVGLRSLARAIIGPITAATVGRPDAKIYLQDSSFSDIAGAVPFLVCLFAVLAFFTWFLLTRTVVGRHLYALGGNEDAARLSGLRTDRLKWLAYSFGALCSTLAGIILIGQIGRAGPENVGLGYELNAIAAAVVGGCSLKGGVGTVPGTVLGALFLRTVMDGIAKIVKGSSDVYEGFIVGIVVVIAVAVNQSGPARDSSRKLFPGVMGAINIVTLSILLGTAVFLIVGGRPGLVVGGLAFVSMSALKILQSRRAARPNA